MKDKLTVLEHYKNWGSSSLGFNRILYTEKIKKYIGNSLVKVLVGQRRVGKSYILRQLAASLIDSGVPSGNIFYVNKELVAFDFLISYMELQQLFDTYLSEKKPHGRVYLFIDEIQEIDGWERFVNSYSQDPVAEYELFISGSNSRMLSSELSTLLSGRYVAFTIHPFSFSEYCAINCLHEDKQSYVAYLQGGGLPELFHLQTSEVKQHYISSLRDTIMLKDIIQRHKVSDTRLLEDVFIYVVNNISNLFSINNIVNYLKSQGRKTSYETIAAFLGYIAETFLIHKVERWNIRGRDVISGVCKYYVNDLAFNNYLYQGFGSGIGYKLENLVYADLLHAGYDVYVGVIASKEVDFVAVRGDRTIYVQASYILADEDTICREYAPLEKIHDHYEKYVVTLDDIALPSRAGIKHIQAWNFHGIL